MHVKSVTKDSRDWNIYGDITRLTPVNVGFVVMWLDVGNGLAEATISWLTDGNNLLPYHEQLLIGIAERTEGVVEETFSFLRCRLLPLWGCEHSFSESWERDIVHHYS
jgi:hypothetical protein